MRATLGTWNKDHNINYSSTVCYIFNCNISLKYGIVVSELLSSNYSPEGEYWKYSTGQKHGVDAFGYNSA